MQIESIIHKSNCSKLTELYHSAFYFLIAHMKRITSQKEGVIHTENCEN